MTNPTWPTISQTCWELAAVMESEVHNNIYQQQATFLRHWKHLGFLVLKFCKVSCLLVLAFKISFPPHDSIFQEYNQWKEPKCHDPRSTVKPRELHVGDVCRAARGGAAAGVGGPGGGLPAAAAPGHSRGLPQTEENIPGQCSYVIIGAQRHQCMHAWEV